MTQIIRANDFCKVRVRVSVNVQAKTTPRTIRANYSRQCETGFTLHKHRNVMVIMTVMIVLLQLSDFIEGLSQVT